MKLLSAFIVLIERRRLNRLLAALLGALALVSLVLMPRTVQAQWAHGRMASKVARDLDQETRSATGQRPAWSRDENGVRQVQVIVVSNSSDPQMADLRRHVQRIGGTVHAVHPAVRALTVQLRASQLTQLSQRSDVVSIHVPLVEATKNLFDATRIARMKRGAYLINASRGGIVDDDALLAALESGQLGGAALDVYSIEPPAPDSPLTHHPRIIAVPHIGASTAEAQTSAGTEMAEGVAAALGGAAPRYAVNAPFVAPEAWGVLQPYLNLARQMGKLITQLVSSPVRSYDVEYCGELAEVDTQPVRLAVLQGLLTGNSIERITPVNAPLIARERGLRLTERTSPDAESYSGLLVVRVQTAEDVRVFSGTVLRGDPHIVQADSYFVDFIPQGALLFTYHRDRPGMIGRVGTLLGGADVNISGMYVGRLAPREQALMVLTLDEPASDAVLRQVEAEDDIQRAIGVVL